MVIYSVLDRERKKRRKIEIKGEKVIENYKGKVNRKGIKQKRKKERRKIKIKMKIE